MSSKFNSVPSLLENRSLELEDFNRRGKSSKAVHDSGLELDTEKDPNESAASSQEIEPLQTVSTQIANIRLENEKLNRPLSASLVTVAQSRKPSTKGPEYDPFSDDEYVFAARLLDSFLGKMASPDDSRSMKGNGASLFDARLIKNRRLMENRHRICSLSYDTLKFIKYIESILIKTQFLVNNQDMIDHLSLVKILLYDLMKHEFNYSSESGIKYQHSSPDSLVALVANRIRGYATKLAAAYARIRIEKQADGDSPLQVLNNILPEELRQKEAIAGTL